MANEKRIIVEIKTTTYQEKKQQEGSPKKVVQDNKQEKKEEDTKAFAAMAVRKVSDLVVNSVEVSMNRYFSMSENYIAETDLKNTMTVINKGRSLVSTVATSAMAGVALGPYGAAAGAIIGASLWVGNEIINYQQRMSNYYQNLNATNYQTEFDRTRMGLTNEGKGTEN